MRHWNTPDQLPPPPKHPEDGIDSLWLLVKLGNEVLEVQRTTLNGYNEDWTMRDKRGNIFKGRPEWAYL